MSSPRENRGEPGRLDKSKSEDRRLVAIMFTDIVGYAALTQSNEKMALGLLEEHRRIIRPFIREHNGREIKTVGDSFLVEFGSALEAANCAIEIQKALTTRNQTTPEENRIQVRIGVHLGDVVHKRGDVYGDAVNIASRIEPLAEPGGICLSEQVNDQIYNKIGLPIDSIGKHKLKNLDRVIEVYKLQLSGEQNTLRRERPDQRCTWCSRLLGIEKIPYEVSGEVLYFDTKDCLVIYRKLKGVYGEMFDVMGVHEPGATGRGWAGPTDASVPTKDAVSEIRFESGRGRDVFGQLLEAFVDDYGSKHLYVERCGWRSLMDLVRKSEIPKSALYGLGGRDGPLLNELVRAGLVEKRIFPEERGRGGAIMKVRVAYENPAVKKIVKNTAVGIRRGPS